MMNARIAVMNVFFSASNHRDHWTRQKYWLYRKLDGHHPKTFFFLSFLYCNRGENRDLHNCLKRGKKTKSKDSQTTFRNGLSQSYILDI